MGVGHAASGGRQRPGRALLATEREVSSGLLRTDAELQPGPRASTGDVAIDAISQCRLYWLVFSCYRSCCRRKLRRRPSLPPCRPAIAAASLPAVPARPPASLMPGEVELARSVEEPRAEQDASAVASTATVDAAVRTLVSPGFEPEDLVEGPVAKYKRDTGKWCCLLCQRQFATETLLAHHLNGGAHLRKLAHAESSGRIKRGAVATGTHHREGASGGAGSGVKAGCLGSQLVSPSPQQGQQGPGPSLPQGASPSAGQRLRQSGPCRHLPCMHPRVGAQTQGAPRMWAWIRGAHPPHAWLLSEVHLQRRSR